MDKEKLAEIRKLKADAPLSITDGAPAVIPLDCGVNARLIGPLDYRIVKRVIDSVKDADDEDVSLLLFYCVMHTTPAEIAKLWKLAQKPKKLYDTFIVWLAAQDADIVGSACQELSLYESELSEEMENDSAGDDGDDDGKKKTT